MAKLKSIKTGIDIFIKHLGEEEWIGGADHDVLWGVTAEQLPEEKLSEEEKEALKEAGWAIRDNSGERGWEIFV